MEVTVKHENRAEVPRRLSFRTVVVQSPILDSTFYGSDGRKAEGQGAPSHPLFAILAAPTSPGDEPNAQHYVHRAYLAGFQDPRFESRGEPALWVYIPEKNPFRQRPDRVAKLNYQQEEKRQFVGEHGLQSLRTWPYQFSADSWRDNSR
jgi:hypothetical protein